MRTEPRPVAPEFALRLRCPADPSDPEGIRRLRAALKRLWRSYGLRALECRPVAPSNVATSDTEAATRENTGKNEAIR